MAIEAALIDATTVETGPHYEPYGWQHWPDQPWWSYQFRRGLGETQEGAGAVSEAFLAASRMTPGDDESWYREWTQVARRNHERADKAEAAGHVLDEQPVPLRTRAGTVVSVPYTVEINDVVISAVQQQPSDEIFRRGRDQFDRLYLDGAKAPRVMAISIRPYLTGVPHRIKYLEMLYDHILGHEGVVMWTGAEILDWYRQQTKAELRP